MLSPWSCPPSLALTIFLPPIYIDPWVLREGVQSWFSTQGWALAMQRWLYILTVGLMSSFMIMPSCTCHQFMTLMEEICQSLFLIQERKYLFRNLCGLLGGLSLGEEYESEVLLEQPNPGKQSCCPPWTKWVNVWLLLGTRVVCISSMTCSVGTTYNNMCSESLQVLSMHERDRTERC